MKYPIIILALLIGSCVQKEPVVQNQCDHSICKATIDSLTAANDSMLHRFGRLSVSYKRVLDSVIIENTRLSAQNIELRDDIDSFKTHLFNANYRLQRIKEYIRICIRNPSQDKFLKGWVRRVIEL